MPRILAVLIIAGVVLIACGSGKPTRAATAAPEAPQDAPKEAAIPQLTYVAPVGVTGHLITGLTPSAAYTVLTSIVFGGLRATLLPGGTQTADSGGVLLIGNSRTAAAAVYLPSVTQ